jgi:diguanylate cyclase (GGDEF)-like protein
MCFNLYESSCALDGTRLRRSGCLRGESAIFLENSDQEPLGELDQLRKDKSQLERDIAHLIRHDQLTGLMNRGAFVHEVDQYLACLDHSQHKGAMIEIGLRGLPRITGSLGRHAGDYAVSALAARLNMLRDADDLVCRLDYWSFAVFVPRLSDPLAALTKAKKFIEALSQTIDWVDRKISLDVSAGVALTSDEDFEAVTLLQNAGLALKAAADKGGPRYGFFNPALSHAAKRRTDILQVLQEAVEKNLLQLYYQPVFSLDTSELVGFEALMRLNDPVLGSISPVEFIPVAEESGLIAKLGAWAMAEACRVASHWPAHLTVAVNISPEQFYSGTLLTDIHNALELSSFPAYRLEVEVTESTMLKDSEMVLAQLSNLRDMGCAIVLDDFGTGYSSLSYLWKFPFSKLKIDRSFIQALGSSPLVNGMLQSIIGLARNLGLKITAEGIETETHVAAMREYKCDFLQGYLCGKPASQTDVAAIILRKFANELREHKTLAEVKSSAA